MAYSTRIHHGAIQAYISNPRGPVYGDLRRRAQRVERAAKRMVGTDTGALRNSIRSQVVPGRKPEIRVGSPLDYALLHHEGTRRHVIRPNLRKNLRFKIRGRVVYATEVIHPGTRPNPYLTVPLMRYAKG